MKNRPNLAGRTALALAALAALGAAPITAQAVGLGRLNVQSALGEGMRAEIDITSLSPEEAATLQVRLAPPDAYRAAGVDYNAVLSGASATVARRADGRPYVRVTSDRAVQEPFIEVIVGAGCRARGAGDGGGTVCGPRTGTCAAAHPAGGPGPASARTAACCHAPGRRSARGATRTAGPCACPGGRCAGCSQAAARAATGRCGACTGRAGQGLAGPDGVRQQQALPGASG